MVVIQVMSRISLDCKFCHRVNQLPLSSFDQPHMCVHCSKDLTDGCVMPVLPHNVNAITNSKLPLLMYFWGANCGNCNIFMPIVEQVARKSRGKYRFAGVYVPKNSALARRYRVRGVPSFVLLKQGKQQAFVHGGLRQKELLQWLKANC